MYNNQSLIYSESNSFLISKKKNRTYIQFCCLEVVNMDLDLDPFADLLSEPVVVNARAGTKFQPKAKPRPKKETSVSLPSTISLSDSTKETSAVAASGNVDTSQFMSPSVDRTQIGSDDLALSSVDASSKLSCGTVPVGPSLHLENQEAVYSTGLLHLNFSASNDDRSSAPLNVSPRHATTEGDLNSTYTSQLGDTITSDIHGDMLVGFGRSEGETADFFRELESLDDILSQPAISNANSVRKFQPKVKANAQPRNKLPISRSFMIDAECSVSQAEAPGFHASNAEGVEVDQSLPVVSSVHSTFRACSSMQTDTAQDFIVSKELLNSREPAAPYNGDSWTDNGRVEREEDAFPGLETFNISSQATTTPGDAHLVPSENEYLDADLTPAYASASYIDFSSVRFSDYVSTETPSEFQVTKDQANLDDASQTVHAMSRKENTESGKSKTILEDTTGMVYSANIEGISKGTMDDRPVSATCEVNETRKSSMQLRKRSVARVSDEMLDNTSENGDLLYEPCNNSLGDIDDNNDNGGEASNHKRTNKKSKKPMVENEKTVKRRKKSSEGPDSSNKEPPKKKFSHSTRRNKRRVNKVLLETPEEEINPRKLAIKDLILLAEAKERLLNKDAAAAKNSLPNQSRSFTANATYNQDNPFASMQDEDPEDDQTTPAVQESTFKLNYHSYMDKIPRERWSKQDTELFYEAIQQFGTDFAMIQQLFPGRTRHQVKLKYKKEERQQPMKLHDALTNRSKDNSHFEMVIERLRNASAEADESFNRDGESVDLTGEEEEVNPETNDEEVDKFDQEGGADTFEEQVDKFEWEGGAHIFEEQGNGAKSEQKKEEVTQDSEPMVNREVHSPVKSHESEEDDYNRWSEYKSV